MSAGAPLVLVLGLVLAWGVKNAQTLKAQIEAWADSLEHSPNPVTLTIPFVPFYVDGERVGKFGSIVVQRDRPGAVDSLRVEVRLEGSRPAKNIEECLFQLDPDAFDREGPLGFKRAVRCVRDTSGLQRFGSVVFPSAEFEAALFVAVEDLPCDHMSEGARGACTEVQDQIRRLRDEVRNDVRVELRNVEKELREARSTAIIKR